VGATNEGDVWVHGGVRWVAAWGLWCVVEEVAQGEGSLRERHAEGGRGVPVSSRGQHQLSTACASSFCCHLLTHTARNVVSNHSACCTASDGRKTLNKLTQAP
jgi:hypothetical protein